MTSTSSLCSAWGSAASNPAPFNSNEISFCRDLLATCGVTSDTSGAAGNSGGGDWDLSGALD